MKFTSHHPPYEYLRKKWIARHRQASESFLDSHSDTIKHLTLGGLGGLLMLSNPAAMASLPQNTNGLLADRSANRDQEPQLRTVKHLQESVPTEVRKLTIEEEKEIEEILSQQYNLPVKAEIDGIKLNRSYGLIGGEQHLYRYPGDTVFKHADTTSDWAMYGGSGIAPGLGAWGYFVPSEAQFSNKDKLRERYYIAVQTFLAPGFAENVGKYRDFFKFRKMLLVNPKTGQAVVTVVGDAGPAEWTGKHLGGSPEVMHFVGYAKGPRKGPVLYFFIDDPKDEVPLGPIDPAQGYANLVKI
ncbi:hypothetical protein A3H85_02765 [Candidatus Daviesbacteria bacterium RIFCSPLOWO2_02_FULL_40_8]|uniref:Uncharacterized protein n=1 Tax=Candidatus Daviesbacteria bacterium RIFCSPLOWO2_01_FULL_40_24 TaxID=1797787 RepID=A0A1F5MII7_9BACT|nr:MAG: hypothetical protein A2780_03490 [Candidatus Daviesbacteria bacterium RIFCSPHIGHO2_01_FULL_41_45]OGE34207.1 MAG: hypothetical protein A3C32_00575 [Candidatus Daviesbacteria bacterium RIFCSPHIGHO2_02_FULL_41_14]OGE65191.1 MAG: hypothetical protein A3B49_01525 [Candidatus Daviesbacteria bacterium RIFCSPLOWO2_01_FULL_40_24]OGE66894.1 MAG: hypothetical protein A3H85_02765 [Candidatus Daviesbacteria bacterium RIFCSPLOWO2_02_FULL_40_8]